MKRQNRYEYWESIQDPNSIYSSYQQQKKEMRAVSQEELLREDIEKLITATLEKELKDLFPPK